MQDKNFIIYVHKLFDELGYRLTSVDEFDAHEFYESCIRTLNRTKTLDDSFTCIELINLTMNGLDKIVDTITRQRDIFESLRYNGNKVLNLVEESNAVFLTDALLSDHEMVGLTGTRFDDDIFYYDYEDNSYSMSFTNYKCPFKTKYTDSLDTMDIVTLDEKLVCTVRLNGNYFGYLENNISNIVCIPTQYGVDVYYKEDVDFTKDEESQDKSKRLVYFYWDTLKDAKEFSLARIEIYQHLEDDLEMLIYLIVLSNFIIFNRSITSKLKGE